MSNSQYGIRALRLTTQNPIVVINVNSQLPLKLIADNYPSWRAQLNSLLHGYDLFGFVDGSRLRPTPTIMNYVINKSTPNPVYALWFFQDQLLLNEIVGSVFLALVYLLATTTTSMDAWKTLESVYAKPSRGIITTLRTNLLAPEQGDRSIMEFMQDINRNVYALALMGQKVDWDDLVLRIIKGLNPVYDLVGTTLKILQEPVTFEELFEQLLNEDAHRKLLKMSSMSASDPPNAFVAPSTTSPFNKYNNRNTTKHNWPTYNNTNKAFRPPQPQQWTPRPHQDAPLTGYLGRCQLCRITGHSAPRC